MGPNQKPRKLALEKLKRLRLDNKSNLQDYVAERQEIYEEVDEQDYQTIVNKRVEGRFVVDDNGEGYVETGLEIWDQPQTDLSDGIQVQEDPDNIRIEGGMDNSPLEQDSVLDAMFSKMMEEFDHHNVPSSQDNTRIGETCEPVQETRFLTNGTCKMFWLDIFDKQNGELFIVGKVLNKEQYESCCARIGSVQRVLLVCPRANIEWTELCVEIENQAQSKGITSFVSKRVTRKYYQKATGPWIGQEYLKVSYSYRYPVLEASGRTYSHIFGKSNSALETLVIKRKLMGPGWIELSHVSSSRQKTSWCRHEIEVDSIKQIRAIEGNLPGPALDVLCLRLNTVTGPSKVPEIVSVSMHFYQNVEIDAATQKTDQQCRYARHAIRSIDPNVPLVYGLEKEMNEHGCTVEICLGERALLNFVVAAMHRYDPDMIVGHGILGSTLEVLFGSLRKLNIEKWSRIGRMVWHGFRGLNLGSEQTQRHLLCGRLVCDTLVMAREFVKSRDYDIKTLSQTVLENKDPDHVWDVGDMNYDQVCSAIRNEQETILMIRKDELANRTAMQLAFKLMMIPLTKALTNVSGSFWTTTLMGNRAERSEYILLHEFYNNKIIYPDREPRIRGNEQGRKKAGYVGGLVLDPKIGYYDKHVLLLDFNSLYPSIIQEFNICFTTIGTGEIRASPEDSMGVLPRLVSSLVGRRKQVKQLLKDARLDQDTKIQLEIRQQALKLTANSMYGCLGYQGSRFYAKELASLITLKGREILMDSAEMVGSLELDVDVIYGDTDSLMINTNTTDTTRALQIGQLFCSRVNEKYRTLEIELESVMPRLILYKKKKYAALVLKDLKAPVLPNMVSENCAMEIKGLDLVRRDWCACSTEASKYILNILLYEPTGAAEKIYEFLGRLVGELAQRDAEQFVIYKSLTKPPEDYVDGHLFPHVTVALGMKNKGLSVRVGDVVPYIMCKSKTSSPVPIHPGDFNDQCGTGADGLQVDFDWYLAQQIFPPIQRLLHPIHAVDMKTVFRYFGLEYKHRPVEEKTKKLMLKCQNCGENFEFDQLVRVKGSLVELGWKCMHCSHLSKWNWIYHQVHLAVRKEIREYYKYWMKCSEFGCQFSTRPTQRYGIIGKKCPSVPSCPGTMKLEMDEKIIYNQLLRYRNVFDIENHQNSREIKTIARMHRDNIHAMYTSLDKIIGQSGFPVIDLGKLFG